MNSLLVQTDQKSVQMKGIERIFCKTALIINHVKQHTMYQCIHIIHVVDILLLNVQYLLTRMYKE